MRLLPSSPSTSCMGWMAVSATLAEQYTGDSFAAGNSAMAIVGPWAVKVYKDVNWGAVPVPTKDGTAAAKTCPDPGRFDAEDEVGCVRLGAILARVL